MPVPAFIGWILLLVGVVALLLGALLFTTDKKHHQKSDSPIERVIGVGSVVCLVAGSIILVLNWIL